MHTLPVNMFKIFRSSLGRHVVFSLSGRIKEEHVSELAELLANEKEAATIAFDLEEVRLVHREAVLFLANCEAQGIALQNCPAFVREWIQRGSEVSHEPHATIRQSNRRQPGVKH